MSKRKREVSPLIDFLGDDDIPELVAEPSKRRKETLEELAEQEDLDFAPPLVEGNVAEFERWKRGPKPVKKKRKYTRRMPVRRKPSYRRSYRRRSSYRRPYYRRRYGYYRGRGAYYAGGTISGSAKIPGVGRISAQGRAGYTHGGGDAAMSKLMGLGAYSADRIQQNALLRPDPPMIMNGPEGTVIRHREFIQNIVTDGTAGAFKIETFAINPAQPQTFPWLSTVAQNFEEYVMEGLVFEFQSTSSDAIASSSNLALGSVMMVTQYDVDNPPFVSAQGVLNYDWSQSCKVSETVLHFVECDPAQNVMRKYFTRSPSENSSDLRFTDMGNFSIATEGLQGTSVNIGRLWVSYQVRLSKPKLSPSASNPSGSYWWGRNYDGAVTSAHPFGSTDPTIVPENNMEITIDTVSNFIRLPSLATDASYYVAIQWRTDSSTFTAGSLTASNCDKLPVFGDITTSVSGTPDYAVSVTKGVQLGIFSVPAYASSPHVGVSQTLGGNATVDIWIMAIPWMDPEIYH